MQSIRTRQLTADLSYNGTKYTTAKPWDLATGTTVNEAAIATEAYVTSAIASVSHHTHVDAMCYVDSNRAAETYTETGSEVAPYRTLSSAISTKLADGETDTVVFVLAPGVYTGTISRDKASQEQVFEIRGSGANTCFIKGSAGFDPTISNVLYFRDFISIKISGVNISNGKYGIYTRNTPVVKITNCEFAFLGSNGMNHGFDRTQAQMAADWATAGSVGSNRSNGGVCRIRESAHVEIRNCSAGLVLRGFRLQDCAQGCIQQCTVRAGLESSFYLASSTYTGANGCSDFLISNCVSEDCFNNAFLVIGGANNSIVGCRSINTANSAVAGWHTQGLNVSGNVFENSTQLAWNGVGNLGDSWGGIFLGGATALVDTEGYMLCAVGNSILRTGNGRHTGSVGFFFGTLDETLTSFRAVVDNNNTDATTAVYFEDSLIPLVNTDLLLPLIESNDLDILANQNAIGVNTTAISNLASFSGNADKAVITDAAGALKASDLDSEKLLLLSTATSDVQTQITGNGTDIATNVTDIAANLTTLATKQAALTWSTVGDDHDTNPVTSKNIKSYVDAAGGGDVYLASVNTFTANQEIKANSNVKLTLEHTGYGSPMEIGNNYGDAGITYVGKSAIKFNGNRIAMSGGCTMLQLPVVSSLNTTNASHSCLCVKDNKLYFNSNGTWEQIAYS